MSQSFRGQCLVSAPHLRESNFFKTVVLIVEHGAQGAMGLVLNRPSTILVSNALAKHFELPNTGDLVYMGGPVEPAALLVLHNAEDIAGDDAPVCPGVYIGSSPEAFEEVIRRVGLEDHSLNFRIYSGCAGWSPGQLEQEVARGDWHVVPPLQNIVYHEDPYSVYEQMQRRVLADSPLWQPSGGNHHWN